MTDDVPAWVEQAAALPLGFAQVREDALLDQWVAGQLGDGARVVLVASGGCTAALLASLPQLAHLHLVDPNPSQLALARLKLHLLQTTPPEERLALLGHAPLAEDQRAARLTAALAHLGEGPEAIGPPEVWARRGPDQAGRYEVLFDRLREALMDHAAALAELCGLRDPAEQARRVAADTDLGQALDRAFDQVMALPHLVRLFGAGATRNRCEPFARHFARRTRHALATLPAADNPYLWQVLRGRYPPETSSPWFTAPAPARLPHVTTCRSFMTEALAAAPGAFDLVQLSNILDWLSPEEARATLDLAWRALRPGGLVFLRQLNSTLDVPALGARFDWRTADAEALHRRDRSFFYRALHLGRKP